MWAEMDFGDFCPIAMRIFAAVQIDEEIHSGTVLSDAMSSASKRKENRCGLWSDEISMEFVWQVRGGFNACGFGLEMYILSMGNGRIFHGKPLCCTPIFQLQARFMSDKISNRLPVFLMSLENKSHLLYSLSQFCLTYSYLCHSKSFIRILPPPVGSATPFILVLLFQAVSSVFLSVLFPQLRVPPNFP